MTGLQVLRAVTAAGGASAVADAAAGAAAATVNSHGHFFSVLAGSLLTLEFIVSTCSTAPAGAVCGGSGFSAASLSLLFFLMRSLVHNDEFVLLPVAGLGVFGAVRGLFEAQCRVSAAAGLCGRVGLAVRSEGALRATNHTFTKTWRQSKAAGLWVLNAVFLHGSGRPLKAPMGSCRSDSSGGKTGVGWHGVGDDGLIVSHVGVGYL